jgi:hypothetical protein
MTNRERLLEAIRQIEAVAGSLNTGGHKCGTCGLSVRENWFEHQASVTFRGLVSKLERTMEAPNLQGWLDRTSAEPPSASAASTRAR